MRRVLLIVCASFATSACATTPHFEKVTGVTPKSIIDVIQCEIIAAKKKRERVASENRAMARSKSISMLEASRPIMGVMGPPRARQTTSLRNFYAVADLTLQVDEQMTLAPSFTHTDVVSKSFTRIFDWGVRLDTQSHRVYTETVQFKIDELTDDKNLCPQRKIGLSLNGNLGIEEVVDMAFGSIDPDDQGVDWATPDPSDAGNREGSKSKAGAGGSGKSKGGSSKAAFGTSIEFNIVGAVTATGPTWSLVSFKGPGKLLSTQRNDTHKVTISFALSPSAAAYNNGILSNESLSSAISRKLLLQLQ
jgi:hypothetical protein